MSTLEQIESGAMELPDKMRAELASRLLESLPAVMHEDDDGLAEALRRDAELDADPSLGMTLEELKKTVGR